MQNRGEFGESEELPPVFLIENNAQMGYGSNSEDIVRGAIFKFRKQLTRNSEDFI